MKSRISLTLSIISSPKLQIIMRGDISMVKFFSVGREVRTRTRSGCKADIHITIEHRTDLAHYNVPLQFR